MTEPPEADPVGQAEHYTSPSQYVVKIPISISVLAAADFVVVES